MKATNNNSKSLINRTMLLVIAVVLLLGAAGITAAWFSSNSRTDTNRITTSTAQQELMLYISPQGGESFQKKTSCTISQINNTDKMNLMPVSTADLKSFVSAADLDGDGKMNSFSLIADEKGYYHGRAFLLCENSDGIVGTDVTLCLESGVPVVELADSSSLILSAARLGLTLDGAQTKIISLSDVEIAERADNTLVGGVLLSDGMVLDGSSGTITAVSDPAQPISDYLDASGNPKMLYELKTGRIYQLDIYFYLEGCDADCVEAISFDGCTLNIQLLGILS